ncbi:hypothetical protein HMPREF9318_00820 [Streptococcus urinalis FB127-CNA-2]|uniref:Branched-chain amino acid transport system carrier protein n=1 Tax=Streptococcus urinalis 2285-97 TaxID=764291 RepID=G5KHV4_9STRE|nr:branched-chain amino acid transport domain protein [Streptococcus urinalis 2285-97]EKS22622.1 hypothetical protein HMPREF9318_00820 [Streptococcus urinalis FB127-CNA-2]VEF32391.1 branched-chain amino acid transport system carrier protein [Streptococcus urinalis]
MLGLFANVGLTNIIALSLPVLMFIYPLAIILIVLTIVDYFINLNRIVFAVTIYTTLLAAIFDGLNASPKMIISNEFCQQLLHFAKHYIPLFNIGMGWVLPALISFSFVFSYQVFFKNQEQH